jgi:hypothetical protein
MSGETIFVPLKFEFPDVELVSVLRAYKTKMEERSKQKGTVTVVNISKQNSNYMIYSIQRKLPEWAIRFFNLNHIEYKEHAKILDNNSIEITSGHTVGNITMNMHINHMYDPTANSTVTTAFAKASRVPKILKKVLEGYIKKQFETERKAELAFAKNISVQ